MCFLKFFSTDTKNAILADKPIDFSPQSPVTLLKVREKLLKPLPKNPRNSFGLFEGTFDNPDENFQPTNEEFLDQSSKLFKHHIFSRNPSIFIVTFRGYVDWYFGDPDELNGQKNYDHISNQNYDYFFYPTRK